VESGKFVFNRKLDSYAAALYYLSAANFEGAVANMRKLFRIVLPQCEQVVESEIKLKLNKLLDALGIMDTEVANGKRLKNDSAGLEHNNKDLPEAERTAAVH
jgi:hypothetical protein